jgi:hypothetical protein
VLWASSRYFELKLRESAAPAAVVQLKEVALGVLILSTKALDPGWWRIVQVVYLTILPASQKMLQVVGHLVQVMAHFFAPGEVEGRYLR